MLEIKNLTKTYHKKKALDGLNLTIQKGELFGFAGPNGAGKTTTMKIIAGILMPDEGEIYINGQDVLRQRAYLCRKIGYMPDFFGIYDNLTVIEYMEFYSDIYHIGKQGAKKRNEELLDLVGLLDRKEELVDEMSRGMKQRLCLARTMIHQPEFLILDEPASGMEPRSRREMKETLKRLSQEGVTILVSSHILPELSELCTHVGIIENGRMVVQGHIKEIMLKQKVIQPLLIRLADSMMGEIGLEHALHILKKHPLVSNIASDGSSISLHFEGNDDDEAGLLAQLVMAGVKVASYRREEGNLEALFLQLTRGKYN